MDIVEVTEDIVKRAAFYLTSEDIGRWAIYDKENSIVHFVSNIKNNAEKILKLEQDLSTCK